MAERFVLLDTETTGLDPVQDRIIDMALVEVVSRKLTGNDLQDFINPEGRPIKYDSFVIHGIDANMLEAAPAFVDVWPRYVSFMGTSPVVIHNRDFDVGFIRSALERHQLTMPENAMIDSIDLARSLWPGESPSLENILKRLGLHDAERAKKHSALKDTQLLAKAWIKMLDMRDAPKVQSELSLSNRVETAPTAAPSFNRPIRKL
jgi:DNA polymerase III subunit epsilon